ncbi:MAG: hypothetical protein WA631_05695 [Nitrososphaeraceae archaeon]
MKSEITAYIKEWKGGKGRLRIERQEYPRKSLAEALDEKLNGSHNTSFTVNDKC